MVAIVALALALNPLNRQFRHWLVDEVVGGVPYWLDHLVFLVPLMLVAWGLIGLLMLDRRDLALCRPKQPREAWLAASVSGLGLSALVIVLLSTLGPVAFDPHPDWPVLFANFASNFYAPEGFAPKQDVAFTVLSTDTKRGVSFPFRPLSSLPQDKSRFQWNTDTLAARHDARRVPRRRDACWHTPPIQIAAFHVGQ